MSDVIGCARIKLAEKQYMDAFNDELESFKDRIRKRAQAKIEEAMRQVEEVSGQLGICCICACVTV